MLALQCALYAEEVVDIQKKVDEIVSIIRSVKDEKEAIPLVRKWCELQNNKDIVPTIIVGSSIGNAQMLERWKKDTSDLSKELKEASQLILKESMGRVKAENMIIALQQEIAELKKVK